MAEPITINVSQNATAAPAVYEVPGAVDVEPLSAFAHFNGVAAGTAFRPALTFYSDGGLILARVFPGDTVAAGDTADVTFAPFLESQSAATPSTSSPAFATVWRASGDAAQSVAATSDVVMPWLHFLTSDQAVFGTGATPAAITNTVNDPCLILSGFGVYYVFSTVTFEAGVYDTFAALEVTGGLSNDTQPIFTPVQHPDNVFATHTAPMGGSLNLNDYGSGIVGAGGGAGSVSWDLRARNGDAIARNVTAARMTALFWPAEFIPTTVFG